MAEDIFTESDMEVIDLFKRTYNASYVDDLTPDKLTILKETLNSTQRRLVDNLNVKPSYNVNYIEGPYYVVKYMIEGSPDGLLDYKTICIFGERHDVHEGECSNFKGTRLTMVEYLKKLSVESRSFIDVYLESPVLRKKPEEKEVEPEYYNFEKIDTKIRAQLGIKNLAELLENEEEPSLTFDELFELFLDEDRNEIFEGLTITEIEKTFKKCFQPSTRYNEDCELMRMHLLDVRSTWGVDLYDDINRHFETLGFILFHYSKNTSVCFKLIELTNANYLINEFAGGLKLEDIFYLFIENSKVKKELEKSYLKEQIQWFIIEELKNLKVMELEANQDLIQELCTRILEKDTTLTKRELLYLSEFFLFTNGIFMDLYTLSRVFKIHDVKTDNHPDKSRNIILYLGKEHAQRISKFITTLNRTPYFRVRKLHEYTSPDEKIGCVKMTR